MSRADFEEDRYKILAAIDEEMTSAKTQCNALKNAEDKDKNLAIMLKINDAISNMKRLYSDLENLDLREDEYEDDSEDDAYASFGTGMNFL